MARSSGARRPRVCERPSNPVFDVLFPGNHEPPSHAVMGQNGAIYIVTPGVAPWSSEVLPVDVDQPSSINDRPTVAVGELIADATGDEILVGDEVGRLVLLTSTQSLIFADGFESGDTGAWKLR